MAEDISSNAAEVWLWAIEHLSSLKQFDRPLVEELVESIPDGVRKRAEEILQSPLPTKSTLELLKEKILGGFISDEYSKRWGRVVADPVESDSALPMETSGADDDEEADIQPPGSESIEGYSTSDDDEEEVDAVLVETSGVNAGVETKKNDLQGEAGGANRDERVGLEGVGDDRDCSVHVEGSGARDSVRDGKQQPSGALVEKVNAGGKKPIEVNQNGSVSSKNARSNDDVQKGKQPSGAAVEHDPLVNGDGKLNEQVRSGGNKPIQTSHGGYSTSPKKSDARAKLDGLLKNCDRKHEQAKSGGDKPVEQSFNDSVPTRSSNDDDVQNSNHQQPPRAEVEHRPLVNGNGNPNNNQTKSDGKKPMETTMLAASTSTKPNADNNQVQNQQQSSSLTEPDNVLEKERVNRKRKKMNDFLESQLQPTVPGLAVSTDLNLCVKCHQSGSVLVCATAGCPMMLHKTCLGFDVEEGGREGSFCCPLCSYSRAVAELHEAQRRVTLTRKDLTTFVVGMQL